MKGHQCNVEKPDSISKESFGYRLCRSCGLSLVVWTGHVKLYHQVCINKYSSVLDPSVVQPMVSLREYIDRYIHHR